MQHKKTYLFIFILVALAQIYVPAKMVYDSEVVLDEGRAFKFKTAPVDPNDPFRGKYITLSYDIDHFNVDTADAWENEDEMFVLLTTDEDGYAKVLGLSKIRPASDVDYVRAKAEWTGRARIGEGLKRVGIEYPFERYYMEESKAKPAERLYWNSNRDTGIPTYALVHVKNGKAVIKDVMVGDRSIRELVEENNELL